MVYQKTKAVDKILALKKRIKIIQGGTSAGKTIAVLLILIDIAQIEKDLLISVVSETVPHLKRGAIRDFLSIMESHRYYRDKNWNKTDFIYSFGTGSKIEFFSADSPDKVRGPRRDILFINECNNVSYDVYTQLAIRTKGDIYLDYNPVSEFWAITDLKNRDDADFIRLTYLDNEGLSKTIIKEIESRKNNKFFWQVYGLGELGELEGRIYTGWQIIDDVPHEARIERRWLDFGYSNDPAAIGDLYYYNGGYVLDEQLYQKKMLNKPLADFLLNLPDPQTLVIADSAEPKSIDEIKGYGVNIVGSKKQGDRFGNKESYVKWSIGQVQEQKISVTKRSLNIIREYRNYLWMTDKDGRILNEEDPKCANHHMAGIRYAVTSLAPILNKRRIIDARPIFINTTARKNPAR